MGAVGLVLTGCGAAPKQAPQPAQAAAPPMVLAAPALATVDGYVTAMTDVLDLTADEVCACGEMACSNEVLGRTELRAETAAIGYRLGKSDTPELAAFLELMHREGFRFSDYLQKERAAWYAQFESRIQICATRIAAASGVDEREIEGEGEGESGDDEEAATEEAAASPPPPRQPGAVKASYQPAGKR